jgi:chaperonin GroES
MQKFPQPLEDRVLILPEDEVKDQSSAFIIPDELKDKPRRGKVMAVGKGVQAKDTGVWIEMQVNKNDVVQFGKFSGSTLSIEGQEYLLMRQSDILFII